MMRCLPDKNVCFDSLLLCFLNTFGDWNLEETWLLNCHFGRAQLQERHAQCSPNGRYSVRQYGGDRFLWQTMEYPPLLL
jgi:hypothetical protein